MKNKILKKVLALSALVLIISCNEDDLTGDSTMTPSNPSLSIALSFDENQTLVEMETTYPFTVSLSEPQITDVVVYLSQVGGSASEGDDFSFPHSLRIPAGTTSLSDVIAIHADDVIEGTEKAIIQIGSGLEANVAGTDSKTVTFNIQNVTSDDLAIGMSWAAANTVTDNSGNEIDATDLADLVLQILDASGVAVHTADGGSFETTAITAADPDGVYTMVASFYAASAIPADLNITASFDQAGVINGQTHDFAAALNTAFVCANNFVTLMKITKSGSSYTIEEVGEKSTYPQDIAGTYDVVSNGESTDSGPTNNPLVNFASTVTVADNGDGTYTLSDGWAGVYIDWYTIYGNTNPEPQVLAIDICLGTLSSSWTDIFGGGQTLTGTINADGTLTIRVDNVYGDFVDAVYTPQ